MDGLTCDKVHILCELTTNSPQLKVTFKAHRELTSLSCFATNKVMDDKKVVIENL